MNGRATQFEEYLKKREELGSDDLIDYIENALSVKNDPSFESFLHGELAFHSKDYKNALKHYLGAKDIPDLQFYCHRASALLSQDMQENAKAIIFANKALKIHPGDSSTLKILENLYDKEHLKGKTIKEYLDMLQESQDDTVLTDIKNFADLNLKELHAQNEDELFHLEDAHVAKEILKEFIAEEREYPVSPRDHLIKIHAETNITEKLDLCLKAHRTKLEDYLHKASAHSSQGDALLFLNTEESLFIRFEGKGIAINPGRGFLDALHAHKRTLLDIDYVIVTHSHKESYQDIKNIYELARDLNQLLGKPHIIHYYFNRNAYQEMIQVLKPSYRQEKGALHCLEVYLDTPDVETIELEAGLLLKYFLTSNKSATLNLGIKLEMQDEREKRTIAYINSTEWSPLLAEHIGSVDILISGFGTTEKSDLEREHYLEHCLGFYGTLNLIEDALPSLAIITEFDPKIEPLRLDIIKKLRESLQKSAILPSDPALVLDLKTLKIQCTATNEWIAPEKAKIIRGVPLQFVSPTSFL